jgi:Flp pilus assembly protein TadG
MRTHIAKGARQGRRGASLIEFSLVFVLFILIIAGLVELGRGVWAFTTIAHATRQGVRFAQTRGSANPPTADQVRDAVRNAAVGLDRSLVTVTTTWPGGVTRGELVTVRATYPFDLVTTGFVIRQSSITLAASSRAIIAN